MQKWRPYFPSTRRGTRSDENLTRKGPPRLPKVRDEGPTRPGAPEEQVAGPAGEAPCVTVESATRASRAHRSLTGREARGSQRGAPEPREEKTREASSRPPRRRTPAYLLFPHPSAARRDDLTRRRPIPGRVGRQAPAPNGHFRGERNRERAGRAPLLRALNPHGGAAGAPPGGLASRAAPAPALNRGGGAGDA